jgi:hypothetical protein
MSQLPKNGFVAVVMPGYTVAELSNWLYTVVSQARKQLMIAHGWRA